MDEAVDVMSNIVFLALLAILSCAVHSLTAAFCFKNWIKRVIGEAFYSRYYTLIYSGVALISFSGVLAYSYSIPDRTLWRIEPALPLYLLQVLGVGIAIWGSVAFNFLEFFGIRQAWGRKHLKSQNWLQAGLTAFAGTRCTWGLSFLSGRNLRGA